MEMDYFMSVDKNYLHVLVNKIVSRVAKCNAYSSRAHSNNTSHSRGGGEPGARVVKASRDLCCVF